MYCINCGVRLSDGEKECPLCGTRVCHPDFPVGEKKTLYPTKRYPEQEPKSWGVQFIISIAMLIPIFSVLLVNLQAVGSLTWGGYAIGAILLGYVLLILPFWFRLPNPIIFVPVDFAAVGVYLLYICLASGGKWFLSFAFPVLGGIGVIVVTVITLVYYVKRGLLYIFGGAALALGAFIPLVEYLTVLTFDSLEFIGWSLYPLVTFVLLGGMLIFLGICRPAREKMERKFFI